MPKFLPYGLQSQLSPLAVVILSFFFAVSVTADTTAKLPQEVEKNVEFDAFFLHINDEASVDLSRFAHGASATPGIYRTAIYVNNVLIDNKEVEFKSREDKSVYPCLTAEIIKIITFNYEKLPVDFLSVTETGEQCVDLQRKLSDAQVNFDSSEQRLDLLIPQIYMLKAARGSVSTELWDSGISALMFGYNVNGYSSESRGKTFNSMYAGVNAGLNIDAWYLRHNGAYNWMEDGSAQYSNRNTYLQRDIPQIMGRALVGQANTYGQLFDTLPFTGIQLASDERMLPASQRGYAPDIRGIARTNARVTVHQNDQVLYETTVTPGEFLINDLYPTGYGGDLEVIVREADGSEQHFRVPYASAAQLLRPGTSNYAVTAGRLRNDNLRVNPELYQLTYQRGLTNTLTGYTGLQASQGYGALQLGAAVGTPVGAVAFDVTQAKAQVENTADDQPGKTFKGQSYQLSYSKVIPETNSNLSLAASRFSSEGYLDFMTAMESRDAVAKGDSPWAVSRAKNRFTVTAGQGLAEGWGQLNLSGSVQNYWNKEGSEQQFQVGYSNQFQRLTYNISANRSYSSLGGNQNNYLLSFTLPLGRNDRVNTPQLRTDLAKDSSGRYGQQISITGAAGKESQLGYAVTAMNANQGVGNSGSLSGSYSNSSTALNGSYSKGKGYNSVAAGLSGTVIGHSGGVTLTPYTSETYALVEAKGAEGASVSPYQNVTVDSRGYAVVPYLNAYQLNDVSIDPKGSAADVELDNTMQRVAPHAGAVVKVKYEIKKGTPILINATHQGEPLSFGAEVFDGNGNSVGSVGQGGQIYARVAQDAGQLLVKWGEDRELQCRLGYRLMPQTQSSTQRTIQQFNSACQSGTPQIVTGQVVHNSSDKPLVSSGW
ncbi:fimbria/pilus outer membrane usher protein [Serratia aquatilis]|uniref:Fimbria/pilus outer membrane usher protein n=1 Tax=Serratia aquatilis TaxID=1737515 RepID=A0ABV6EEY9_9GAMM